MKSADLVLLVFSLTVAALSHPVDDVCLWCLCQEISKCDLRLGVHANGIVWGPFAIGMPYWIDGGKQVLDGDDSKVPGAFERCVQEPFCAARTIRAYYDRYINVDSGDPSTNCYNITKMHIHGFAKVEVLSPVVTNVNRCYNDNCKMKPYEAKRRKCNISYW